MKKKRTGIMLLILILLSVGGSFFIINRVPGRYAVREEEFGEYEPYILVQEVHYTGTGWVQTGDERGYRLPEEYIDVDLINGNILPQMGMYNIDYANTFLCKVEYKGKIEHAAFDGEVDSYYITDWYPVYPVLRDTFLPQWLYPENFLTKREVYSGSL